MIRQEESQAFFRQRDLGQGDPASGRLCGRQGAVGAQQGLCHRKGRRKARGAQDAARRLRGTGPAQEAEAGEPTRCLQRPALLLLLRVIHASPTSTGQPRTTLESFLISIPFCFHFDFFPATLFSTRRLARAKNVDKTWWYNTGALAEGGGGCVSAFDREVANRRRARGQLPEGEDVAPRMSWSSAKRPFPQSQPAGSARSEQRGRVAGVRVRVAQGLGSRETVGQVTDTSSVSSGVVTVQFRDRTDSEVKVEDLNPAQKSGRVLWRAGAALQHAPHRDGARNGGWRTVRWAHNAMSPQCSLRSFVLTSTLAHQRTRLSTRHIRCLVCLGGTVLCVRCSPVGREGKGREGKGREGKGREGREGKGREGKGEREGGKGRRKGKEEREGGKGRRKGKGK